MMLLKFINLALTFFSLTSFIWIYAQVPCDPRHYIVVTGISQSKRSISIDKGSLGLEDSIGPMQTGKIAYFAIETRDGQFLHVAQGELILAKAGQSYWFLSDIEREDALYFGAKLVFFDGPILSGRAGYTYKQKNVLGQTKADYVFEKMYGVPPRYSLDIENHVPIEENIVTDFNNIEDFETVSFENYKEKGEIVLPKIEKVLELKETPAKIYQIDKSFKLERRSDEERLKGMIDNVNGKTTWEK